MEARTAQGPRSVLGQIFLTVFLDIVGFSVIFPLFPRMLEHYLNLEGRDSTIGNLVAVLDDLARSDGGGSVVSGAGFSFAVVALFGGVLGSLYSILQFLFAPIWGGLSDRIGRRPTLLITLTGTVLGYVLWVYSGRFVLLIVARLLGGMMAGNISTASAAVADTTSEKDRAKGMGIVGMAIGLGFVMGPAIGGFFSKYRIDDASSSASAFSLNPFSVPALAALSLALVNLLWVATRFRETWSADRRSSAAESRTLHPFARLRQIDVPGVKRTNFIYLVFLTAFSAMEFTLTFLASERFDYGPRDNMWMFVFVGLVMALVQGGFVRRLAPRLGERKLSQYGLVLIVPGLLLVGLAKSSALLYAGLFFMAVGSALATPCLGALVSRYTPSDRQGLALGVFRSMGSLSRAIGPIIGGVLYWQLGSAAPYLASSVAMLVPIALAATLPPVPNPSVP